MKINTIIKYHCDCGYKLEVIKDFKTKEKTQKCRKCGNIIKPTY
jgi:uncharacterized Zn finger protein